MTLTNAERQRNYRERHLKAENGTASRINTLVDDKAKLALERIAAYYGVTQREALEQVIGEHQAQILAGLDGIGQGRYFDRQLQRNEEE